MVEQKSNLFRKKSLERLSSPERLDQLMQVISPMSWLPLMTLGSLVVAALAWSIWGCIPVTVEGRGVLIYPRKVVPLQSKSAGQILSLEVSVGDDVQKGDVLATLDQANLRKQLQLAEAKLAQLQSQDRDVSSLQQQRRDRQLDAIAQQRQTLQESLQIVQELTPVLRVKGLDSIQSERQTLQRQLQNLRQLLPTYTKRLANRQMLFQEGAIADDVVLQARQEYLDSLTSINDAEAQLKRLDVQEADAQRQYLENLNSIKDIKAQLQELDSQEATSAQDDLESTTARIKEIAEVKREIAQLKEQLSNNSQIISQHSGRVLELAVNPGQMIDTVTRLGSIDVQDPQRELVGITYFTIADGKKIQSQMPLQITPQTVKRERFGGIDGTVTTVSPFPITKEAAASVVGNPEVVAGLVSQEEGLMQVFSTLETDPATDSGYQWSSSQGPQLEISSGTTTAVRVTVEERSPITYVFPILRSVSGIY